MRWLGPNLTLLLTWLLVQWPVLRWLAARWAATEGHLHLALAGVLLVGVLARTNLRRVGARLAQPPRWAVAPVLWAALPPLAAALIARAVPVDLPAAVALVASAYGLVGLYVGPGTWRRLRGAAGLGMALLPLTGHLDVFLGFPLRALTASIVADLLGPAEVTSSTVLAVDGSLAYVDLPCSGVQSLWSGAVVLLGAAVAWRRPVDLRFAGIVAAVSALLIGANAGRVLALVALDHVLRWPLAAEIVHVPLGVIGFVVSVGAGLLALHRTPAAPIAQAPVAPAGRALPAAGLVAAWLVVPLLPRATASVPVAPPALAGLPAGFDPVPLTTPETAFADDHGARVVKATFARGGARGSVVMVASRSWLAHHVPTWCLESQGWSLSGEHPAALGDHLVRTATAERDGERTTAVWWFRGPDRHTDDHTVRILSGLGGQTPWVLVSLLLDDSEASDADVAAVVADIHHTVSPLLESP